MLLYLSKERIMLKLIAIILGLVILPIAKASACDSRCTMHTSSAVEKTEPPSCCDKPEQTQPLSKHEGCNHGADTNPNGCICGCFTPSTAQKPLSVPVQPRTVEFHYDVLVKVLTFDEIHTAVSSRRLAYVSGNLYSDIESPRYLINNVFRI